MIIIFNSNTHVLFQDGLFEHLLVVLQPSTPAEKNVMTQQFCSDLQGETFALVVRHNKLIFDDCVILSVIASRRALWSAHLLDLKPALDASARNSWETLTFTSGRLAVCKEQSN